MTQTQRTHAPPLRDIPDTLRGKRINALTLTPPPETLQSMFQFRSWHSDDAPVYKRMLDDPALWQFMPEDYPAPMTLDLAQDLIALSQHATHHKVRAVLWNGQIVGQMRLEWAQGATPPASGEISYWLGRAYWGQGLSTRMVALFAYRCFSNFPALQHLHARIHHENTPSLRIIHKLGFQPTPEPDPHTPDWGQFVLPRGAGPDWAALAGDGA
ncbi:GNAT family N-acetyltransferase [Roseinatronobacter sp. NSM]|uniref:GNAT family N-acetyltransferase n=1 Tax=Roseinatronobacter sp. NSM TaxID=3457785 RepID=UPI004035859A